MTFSGDVRLYIKGSVVQPQIAFTYTHIGIRDPCEVHDTGCGFVFCWQGNPEIRIGYENPQKELIQVLSEGMLIAIPA